MDAGIAIAIILILCYGVPFLFSAVKESGVIKPPSLRRRSTFRQFPLHDDADVEK
jgi:hypothetical protein